MAIGVTAALVHLIDEGEFPLPQLPAVAERKAVDAPALSPRPALGR
jgi:hypothetical protein